MDSPPPRRILVVGLLRVSVVMVAMILMGIAMDRVFSLPSWMTPDWQPWGTVPLMVGIALEAVATRAFWKYGSGTPHPAAHPNRLVTDGPYAWSRNPLYLARLVVLVGTSWILGSIGVLVVALVLFIGLEAVLIPREETRLEARLGKAYAEYRVQVARWLTLRRRHRGRPGL